MNEQTHLPVGAVFHGYRIEALIGSGGMGVVYRAFDLRLKRTVALKLMAPDLGLDARFRERFSRESELAMLLEHPNVVPIYDAGEADGRLYLAMREVGGADLRALLRTEGPLEPTRTLVICAQIAAALDAAHAKGLVHRDVKPSNVLLDSSEHVYLADFGLTRRFADQGTASGDSRSLGTPAYLAPEQIEGGAVDGRADVYSLACLLYECLTAEAPFASGSRLGVAWAHLEQEPPSASAHNGDLPAAIDPVIERGMAKDPKDRYATCGELISAARQALGLGNLQRSRRRTLVLVAGAASLVTFAALVAALVLTRGDPAAATSNAAVRANTLVRIDPQTNAIKAVIDVGEEPVASAVAGRTIWVYNHDSKTVSEVDATTNAVRNVTSVSALPLDLSPLVGPVLAADGGGAWLIGLELKTGKSLLTRLQLHPRRKVEHRIDGAPYAVAVDSNGVWVVVGRRDGNVLLRIDPDSGEVERTTALDSPNAKSLGVGEGRVWVGRDTGGLYRVDPHSGKITGRRDVGACSARPGVGLGSIWLCVCNPGSSMLRVDPVTLHDSLARNSVPAQDGMFTIGYESLWWHDMPSGTVVRFAARTGDRAATIPVTRTGEPGVTTTSVATGAGGVWVTVADT